MKQYSFVFSNKTYQISGEKELIVLLKLMSGDDVESGLIHWNILVELDSDLEKIITTYFGLLSCLKYLNTRNSFLLLLKLGDVLGDIILNSQQLAEVLSQIPEEENKIKLLTIMRKKGLSKIIFDAHDLGIIFSWLYGKSQKEFMEILGHDLVRDVFMRTNEIIMTLHYLTNSNKNYLMDILGLEGIRHKIKTSENFLVMFKGLTLDKAKDLLSQYPQKEIFDFFRNDEEFHYFLLRLPEDKEKLFLDYLQQYTYE